MVANHTPGPWLANKWGHRLDKIVIESDEFFIAEVNFCSRQEANANLIAAAPKLLAALQQMLEAYSGVHDTVGRNGVPYQTDGAECAELAAREAIAEAMGNKS